MGEDAMFYRDKVVLGEANLLDDGVKIGFIHPKRSELERRYVME